MGGGGGASIEGIAIGKCKGGRIGYKCTSYRNKKFISTLVGGWVFVLDVLLARVEA